MGNQNTTGIVEEEKAKDEGIDIPSKHLEEENKAQIEENAAEADSADQIPPAEGLVSDKRDLEDDKVSVEGSDNVIDIGTNISKSDEGRSNLSREEQDQPCSIKEIQEEQNMLVEETLEVDTNDDAEKNVDDDLALSKKPSVFLEASEIEEVLVRDGDHIQEEQSKFSYTVNDVPKICMLNSSTAENEHGKECLPLYHQEKKPMVHELDNADTNNTSCVDQCQPSDQEINPFLIRCSSDPTDMMKSEFEENRENLLDDTEPTDQIMLEKAVHLALDHEEKKPTIHELDNADTNDTICVDQCQPSDQETNWFLIGCSSDPTDMIKTEFKENRENLLDDTEATDQNMLEKAVHWESEPSPIEKDHETESETTGKYAVGLPSSMDINTDHLSSKTASVENPPILPNVHIADGSASYVGAQVELRKSPSFDFGISFDARSEESDQTPLLYDRTSRRSLSICSNVMFQNSGVQTEYVGKALQFEPVQVEEKTIRMERSNSESSQALNKNQENANKESPKNSSNASPTRYDEATISPKGNIKRKPRSSFFTTCICCTAAIS